MPYYGRRQREGDDTAGSDGEGTDHAGQVRGADTDGYGRRQRSRRHPVGRRQCTEPPLSPYDPATGMTMGVTFHAGAGMTIDFGDG